MSLMRKAGAHAKTSWAPCLQSVPARPLTQCEPDEALWAVAGLRLVKQRSARGPFGAS